MNLDTIIARATPPPERIGSGAFEPIPTNPDSLARRKERATAAFGSFERLAAHAKALGVSPGDWIERLGDVRLSGPAPDWARAFCAIYERLQEGARPFAKVRRWLQEETEAGWPDGLPHASDTLDGPLAYLAGRIGAGLAPTWFAERRLGLRSDWAQRLGRSPVLAYVLGRLTADWLRDINRMIERAAADRTALAGAFFDGADPGRLLRIEAGLGDPHFGGRSVAIFQFERGGVVYKPKDLRVASAVGEIAGRVGEFGLAPPETLLRGTYAWEPVHHTAPISGRAEADRFYGALGGWLAILQALGGIDFWFDNLIAQGSIPRFIDFETAVQPPADWTMGLPPAVNEAAAHLRATALGVGILPLLMPTRDGEDPTDIGCLSRPGEHRTPVPNLAGGLHSWREDRFAPRYGSGAPADAAEHFDAFEDGYLRVARALASPAVQGDALVSLRRVADAPIRVIRLDTWTCYRMIQQSLAPRYLGDGVWRELAIHSVLPDRPDMIGPLCEAAVRDLRRLDVPLFQTRLDSRDLFDVEGGRLPDFFERDAIGETRDRLQTLARIAATERIAWIRSGFGLRLGNPVRNASAPADGPPADSSDLLAWADEVASFVAGAAVTGLGGAPTWIGFVHDVFTGFRGIGPLGLDILSGRAGVALALAELGRVLDRPDLADLAREALHGAALEFVGSPRRFLRDGAGYVVGVGGLVAALARDATHRPLALEAYRTASSLEVWKYSGPDFVSGLAGWCEAALALSESPPSQHGKARPYAPSARPRLSIWLDPKNATVLCGDRRSAARRRRQREREGCWFADRWLNDRHNLSGIDGLPALALRFVHLAGSDLQPSFSSLGLPDA